MKENINIYFEKVFILFQMFPGNLVQSFLRVIIWRIEIEKLKILFLLETGIKNEEDC